MPTPSVKMLLDTDKRQVGLNEMF